MQQFNFGEAGTVLSPLLRVADDRGDGERGPNRRLSSCSILKLYAEDNLNAVVVFWNH